MKKLDTAGGFADSIGAHLTVSGWGTTSEGGQASDVPLRVRVPIVSNAQCNAAYGAGSITAGMVCAGFPDGGRDSCQVRVAHSRPCRGPWTLPPLPPSAHLSAPHTHPWHSSRQLTLSSPMCRTCGRRAVLLHFPMEQHTPWSGTHLGAAHTLERHTPWSVTHLGAAHTMERHTPWSSTHLAAGSDWARCPSPYRCPPCCVLACTWPCRHIAPCWHPRPSTAGVSSRAPAHRSRATQAVPSSPSTASESTSSLESSAGGAGARNQATRESTRVRRPTRRGSARIRPTRRRSAAAEGTAGATPPPPRTVAAATVARGRHRRHLRLLPDHVARRRTRQVRAHHRARLHRRRDWRLVRIPSQPWPDHLHSIHQPAQARARAVRLADRWQSHPLTEWTGHHHQLSVQRRAPPCRHSRVADPAEPPAFLFAAATAATSSTAAAADGVT